MQIERLDGILFTHEHADHTAGIDDIRPFFFNQGDIPIYAHKRVLAALHRRFDYIFEIDNKYPGAPGVDEHIIENSPFELNGMQVIPVNGYHHELQVFGFRFNKFAYLTDMKTLSDIEKDKLKGLDVLVVNALRHEQHVSHFNLEEALELIESVQPKQAYLTHISHLLGFHEDVQQKLPKDVFLAYDGLVLNL